jgi:hypothetical protein
MEYIKIQMGNWCMCHAADGRVVLTGWAAFELMFSVRCGCETRAVSNDAA